MATAPDLDQLLARAMQNPAEQNAFDAAVADATLFVPFSCSVKIGNDNVIPAGATLSHFTVSVGDQDLPVAYTTNEVLLAEIKTDNILSRETGRSLARMLRQGPGLAIKGSDGLVFYQGYQLANLADGKPLNTPVNMVFDGNTSITLGVPAVEPKHILSTLQKFFVGHRGVRAAYRAQMKMDGAFSLVIGIEADSDIETLETAFWPVIDSVRQPGDVVDLLTIGPDSTISDYLIKKTEPFYVRRKWFGLL